MKKREEVNMRLKEMDVRDVDKQLNTILEKIDEAVERGKRSITFTSIMHDKVRTMLELDDFVVKTTFNREKPDHGYLRPEYEISW